MKDLALCCFASSVLKKENNVLFLFSDIHEWNSQLISDKNDNSD
jgi:hypothetical protein